jgi:hypothetical protein
MNVIHWRTLSKTTRWEEFWHALCLLGIVFRARGGWHPGKWCKAARVKLQAQSVPTSLWNQRLEFYSE